MCDGESGRSPKRFSGRLRFRQHSAFPYFSRVWLRGVCLSRRRVSAVALVSKTSTRHGCNLLLSIRYIVISWLEKGGFIEQKYRKFIYGSIWHNISTMPTYYKRLIWGICCHKTSKRILIFILGLDVNCYH